MKQTRFRNAVYMNNPLRPCEARVGRLQLGLTLVELLVSMTLGLIILLAIGSVYLGSRATYRMQEDNARLQETGRYALEVLGRSLRQAGYWNIANNVPNSRATGFGGTVITGSNGVAGAPDTVTVQYDSLAGDRDCEGNALVANAVVQDAYRLNGNNLQCDGNADGVVDHQTLVSDIEDVQVLYGIDTNNDQSVDRYVVAPANWGQVYSVRVCVLARSANHVNNVRQNFLNCGGALGTSTGGAAFTQAPANDFRLRRAFVGTFSLRNRITNMP